MAATGKAAAAAALCFLSWLSAASALTISNISTVIQSPYPAAHVPTDVLANCSLPGICVPATVTFPPYSLWYWCGFYATHKSEYSVITINAANATIATSANLSSALMRQNVLQSQVLANISDSVTATAAPVLLNSGCSSLSVCAIREWGFAFPDNICLVIVNGKSKTINAKVQMNNYYSRSRYYGTVFCILSVLFGSLAWLAALVIKCTSEWNYTTYNGGHNHNVNHLRKPILDLEQGALDASKAPKKSWFHLSPHEAVFRDLVRSWFRRNNATAAATVGVRPRSG